MTYRASNQSRTEPDDESIAPENGVEEIELTAEDAATVTGGTASSFLWVGSRTDGRS